MKATFEFEISDLFVTKDYFSFDYIINKDGQYWRSGEIIGNHGWDNHDTMRNLLEGGHAYRLITEKEF